jgi:hypothetical protein
MVVVGGSIPLAPTRFDQGVRVPAPDALVVWKGRR